jgi:hypothetical protein
LVKFDDGLGYIWATCVQTHLVILAAAEKAPHWPKMHLRIDKHIETNWTERDTPSCE